MHFAQRTFALDDLRERGARAAHRLAELDVGAGDVVGILLRNEPAFVEALTCLRCLDAVLVLIPWHLTAEEMRPIMEAVRPRLVITHSDLAASALAGTATLPDVRIAVIPTPPEVLEAFALTENGEPASGSCFVPWEDLIDRAGGSLAVPQRSIQAIAVTSGSTGRPKIIHRDGRQRWLQWASRYTQDWPAIRRSVVTAPLYHTGQYGVFSQACHLGADQVILARFDPEAFLRAVEKHRINHAYLSPPMFVQLLRLPERVRGRYDVSTLDYLVQTGAPCAPDIKRQMIEWLGPVIWEVYGTSETSTIASCSSQEWLRRPGTVGRPLRPVVALSPAGTPCPPGESGELYVDVSDMPRLRYQNADVRRRMIDGREFVSMGDVGSLDGEGYLWITGRVDEVINNGRVKVYPQEIEGALLQHPSVLDCVAFAMPDPVFGQSVAATVQVTSAEPDLESELLEFLGNCLSPHKIPMRIWHETEPLRVGAGKVNRRDLARRYIGLSKHA